MQKVFYEQFGTGHDPYSLNEMTTCKELMRRTLNARENCIVPDNLIKDWRAFGWHFYRAPKTEGQKYEIWVLAEAENKRYQGVYWFRLGSDERTILAAPHADASGFSGNSDKHTGIIVEKMFATTDCAVAAIATANRDDNNADMSRNTGHAYYAMVDAYKNMNFRFCEIHGFTFDAERVDTDSNPLEGIVSNGSLTYTNQSETEAIKAFWSADGTTKTDYNFQLYGEKANALGATTNLNGQLLNGSTTSSDFLHVEHRIEMRQLMKDSDDFCREYYAFVRKRV